MMSSSTVMGNTSSVRERYNSVEVDHLHIGTMQAAPDAAVGSDKLTIRVTLLHLVDNAVLGRNDEGFGVGIFRNAAYHRRG